ncbi:hypothetical protein [Sporanaerobacter acetigenes]|uniref:ABC-2 type transport system permease protein n=1 Tax=Sporanaerobacter acetigenes DSM 13106 TaxID=1123281 RepID=A0A1M5YVJ3_9FIRM|nr:hypothetical protein [Sporanaerobacter acetigenes]SHI15870.1 hypothetical protein SAMN02745180_02470 [Sporanaerobacter acetigenes DSM 13106]
MKDFKILKFLDKFKPIFEKFGVDYCIMRKILQVKLMLDERRVPTVMKNNTSKKKSEEGNSIVKSLWFYILLGLMLVPFVIMKENYLFQMSFLFGILMFMMMTILISDFSSVLLDLRDKDIILSKPVDGKTLSAAKIVHILIYMFYITFSFTGPALLVSLFRHGFLFFIIFLLEIILMDLLIVALTALLYLLILKFFDGEKLKDIINYVQIILSIALSVGYQLIGRLFNFSDVMNIDFVPKWWQYLIPSMWFGGPFELIVGINHSSSMILFSALALIVPILSIIIYVKLTPSFESNLQKLNNSSGNVKVRDRGLNFYLSNIFCRTKEERTFFRFATNMMKKERNFKLKTYPSLGISLVFPFIFLLSMAKDEGWANIANSKMYFNIYFVVLMIPTILMVIGYSDKYKGAWIYKFLPFTEAKDIFKGTLKAFVINLLLPMYVFESIVFMIIFKGKIALDLIIAFLNIILFIVICFKCMKKTLPFSEPFEVVSQSQGFIVIPLFLVIAALAGVHYGATKIDYGRYIYILILVIANIFAWNKAFNISIETM